MWEASASHLWAQTRVQCVNGCLHPWVHPEWEVKRLLAHSSLLFCHPAPVVNRTLAVVLSGRSRLLAGSEKSLLAAVCVPYSAFLARDQEILEKKLNGSAVHNDFWSSFLVTHKGPVRWINSETVLTKWEAEACQIRSKCNKRTARVITGKKELWLVI